MIKNVTYFLVRVISYVMLICISHYIYIGTSIYYYIDALNVFLLMVLFGKTQKVISAVGSYITLYKHVTETNDKVLKFNFFIK